MLPLHLSLQRRQPRHSARPKPIEYLIKAVVDSVVVEVLLLRQLAVLAHLELLDQLPSQHWLDLSIVLL